MQVSNVSSDNVSNVSSDNTTSGGAAPALGLNGTNCAAVDFFLADKRYCDMTTPGVKLIKKYLGVNFLPECRVHCDRTPECKE